MDINARLFLHAVLILLLAGCTVTRPTPYHLETIAGSLATACSEAEKPPGGPFLPGGIAVVRDQGRETILTSVGDCVVSVDTTDGTVTRLKAAGEFAASAIGASDTAIFLVSRAAGAVEWLDPKTGRRIQALGGFQRPLGARLVPGDSAYVAEFDTGRIVRVRPATDARPVVIASDLAGPADIVVTDPKTAYVSEMTAGQLTRIGLLSEEHNVVLKNLDRPQGIAQLPDGRLAVIETGLRRIIAVDVTRKSREVLFDNLPIGAPGEAAPDSYAALGIGADGVLYLVSDLQGALLRLVRVPTAATP